MSENPISSTVFSSKLKISNDEVVSTVDEGRKVMTSGPLLMSPNGGLRESTTSAERNVVRSDAVSMSSLNIVSTSSTTTSSDKKTSSKSVSKMKKNIAELFGGAITMELERSFEDVSIIRPVPDHQEVYVDKHSETSIIVELLTYENSVTDQNAAKYYFDDLASCNEALSSTIIASAVITSSEDPIYIIPHVESSFNRCVLIGQQSIKKFNSSSGGGGGGVADETEAEVDHIMIFLTILRLKSVATDLVLTVNAPMALLSHIDPSCLTVDVFNNSKHSINRLLSPGKANKISSGQSDPFASIENESVAVAAARENAQRILLVMKKAIESFTIVNWSLFA